MAFSSWLVGSLVVTSLLLSGCHTERWTDADVFFAGEFDPQGGDQVTHKYRFELPQGKQGWRTCSAVEAPAKTRIGFDELGWGMSMGAVDDGGSCNEEHSRVDPGQYTFFIEGRGKGSYRVALYFQ